MKAGGCVKDRHHVEFCSMLRNVLMSTVLWLLLPLLPQLQLLLDASSIVLEKNRRGSRFITGKGI
jgi:hypothetical protein